MNTTFRCLLIPLFVLAFAGFAFADDFKSIVIPGDGTATTQTPLPRIHGDQFMVIRNFTQEGTTANTRGEIMVTKPPTNPNQVSILTAAILDPANPPEVINSVIIAGAADVSATCGAPLGSNCFISFKKEGN